MIADCIMVALVPSGISALYAASLIYIARLKSDKAEKDKIHDGNHSLFFPF